MKISLEILWQIFSWHLNMVCCIFFIANDLSENCKLVQSIFGNYFLLVLMKSSSKAGDYRQKWQLKDFTNPVEQFLLVSSCFFCVSNFLFCFYPTGYIIYISVEKWYFNERNRRSTKSVFLCLCLDFIDMPFYQKESELLLVTRGWRLSPFGISFRFPFKLFFGLLKVESRLNIKCHFHERLISK